MKKNQKKHIDISKAIKELNTLRKSLLNFNFQKSTGQLEKTSEIRKTKRKISSILTSINQSKDTKNA